ncbi:hypothetical protein MASR2M15_18160 [Anaerolineales bacterium]
MSHADELKEQGITFYSKQDYESAIRSFREAKEAYEADHKEDMAAEMRVNIGLMHSSLGEPQLALDEMQAALHVFQSEEDALRMAQVLGNMGGVYLALNDKEQAYTAYRQAADIFLQIDEMKMYGETLVALGAMQLKDGKISEGAAMYQVALDYIDNPTTAQKIMKRLSGFINRLNG